MKKLMDAMRISGLILISAAMLNAQTITISGKVTDFDSGEDLPGVNVLLKGTSTGVNTDLDGKYSIKVSSLKGILVFSYIGMEKKEVSIKGRTVIDVKMEASVSQLSEVVVTDKSVRNIFSGRKAVSYEEEIAYLPTIAEPPNHQADTEEYEGLDENTFQEATQHPLSTFSIDVDAASYSNMRRFINNGQNPPKDAVRIEEMINYFNYDYKQPTGQDPFSINTEVAPAPWDEKHQLVQIGLQGKVIPTENLPASNLVFLLDVSGSMFAQNKLPLLKSGLKMLVDQLREEDKVSIVVYAGAAGCVLPPTSGKEKDKIIDALQNLQAGGSTAGGAGIELAYKIAKENFMKEGNNRIILATDGDFNVGASSNEAMEDLIEMKRKEGVFLTVLGFGMGNYKDSKMEILADKGNGNYAYIDNILEAKKVLVNEFGGTLFTIAKDVKIQVEFNPANVTAYRLIGYENRKLNNEDFNNDKKDAGELGSGHTVTALYEIIPKGVNSYFKPIDDLKYQENKQKTEKVAYGDELLTVKFRYKAPNEEVSQLIVKTVDNTITALGKTSDNFRWSAAVATYGMLLKDSDYLEKGDYKLVTDLAQSAKGKDENGYRIEFIKLVESSSLLAKN
ncbi:von Willebrand factor type A domain-containing protein [Marivirga harenae]|uniref:vWA domain-containing protein n=1 Tax=Marivirga harenae TaxID=2010992 RepID=UPI0026DF6F11|nr:von Willebrand factor type A domain-containing protein [Marivirga harenae]WKV13208.1 von Willebrand factor type A domain-containing protein [Marivirga harenae]|tara:strand:- start:924 stop:2780 length:1857 start_codon:yes stop_codon:yes gene_type:complete